MDESVLLNVRQVVADIFDQPLADVSPESSPQTLPGWDSLGHLNLVVALEQEFGLHFSPAEVERIRSVATAAWVIEARNSSR